MSNPRYKIVFAGTPNFAIPSLLACIKSNHDVCAVYTQRDKPRGRGQELSPSPVKKVATEHNIPVHTPLSFKNTEAISELKSYEPDLIIVVAYGMILPQEVLDIPKITCLNVHSSLLPRWRGAAPINRAIMAGDSETGVSIMRIVKELDAGAVFKQVKYSLNSDDDALTVHNCLARIGADALLDTVDELHNGHSPKEQDQSLVTYAAKIKKSEGELDFSLTKKQLILNFKGLQPWPGSFFRYNDQLIKVHDMFIKPCNIPSPPGTIMSWDKAGLVIKTIDGSVVITLLQFPGKKPCIAHDIINSKPDYFKIGTKITIK